MNNNIDNIFNSQVENSNSIRQTGYRERINKINLIVEWIYNNNNSIQYALRQDLSKPDVEIDITEIWVSIDLAKDIIRNLKNWMCPQKIPSTLPVLFSRSSIEYFPKGVCLIISPWNYPFQLCIAPLLYAIAAGNCAILKPSEFTPRTSQLISKMFSELFNENEIAVIEGDKEQAKALLEKPFNHIFFTGNTEVGRKVAQSASKHLSSITLELGGKSPVIIENGYKLKNAVERIVATKFINLGQTCIAPDYIIIHKDDKEKFIDLLIHEIELSYGFSFKEQLESASLARVVNDSHFARLQSLIDENKNNIIYGGEYNREDRFISPTVINADNKDSSIMCDEIFGPIIPITTYSSNEELHLLLKDIKSPLSLYIFSNHRKFINKIKSTTSSGSICVNDVATQFINHNLPFGGVMSSGQGRYHGFSGFKEFSNMRSITHQSKINFLKLLNPPYNSKTKKLVDLLLSFYRKL